MSAPEDDDLVERANARVGARLKGKYTLDRVLGIGGMATVYAGTHRNGKEFAIKVLHADLSMRADTRTRFLREGYLANRVNHPGAVAVLDDDVADDGGAFLVMERIHGETVETLWERQRGRLPLALVAGIGLQLLDVLAAAHGQGLIHRDIKPGNLMLTRDGLVKVLDFGIARLRDMAGGQATQTGMVMGTPAFMAPEHAMAKTEEVDAQTDVWSVGATMFTLATGKLVHEADNTQQLLIKAATTPARPVASLMPTMPKGLAEVIDRALAFGKSERWSSAATMQTALREAALEAFETVPIAPVLAEMLDEWVGHEKAKGQTPTELPAPAPEAAIGSDEMPAGTGSTFEVSEAPGAALGPGGSATQMAAGAPESPPGVGAITAAAVASDSSLLRTTISGPRRLIIAAGGLAALAVGGLLLVVMRASPATDAPTVGSATRSTAVAAPSPSQVRVGASAASEAWSPVATATPSIAPPPAAALPVPALSMAAVKTAPSPPSPPATLRVRPVSTDPAAPVAAPAKTSCTPPYEFDENGNKRWKRECL